MKNISGLSKKGRPKNSLNTTTKATKEVINQILEDNLQTIQEDLNQLKPYERIKVMLELMQYTTPKLKAVEVTEPTNKNFTPVIINMNEWI